MTMIYLLFVLSQYNVLFVGGASWHFRSTLSITYDLEAIYAEENQERCRKWIVWQGKEIVIH